MTKRTTKAWQVFDVKQRAINEGAMWKAAGNKVIIRKVKERAYPGKILWGVFVYPHKLKEGEYGILPLEEHNGKWIPMRESGLKRRAVEEAENYCAITGTIPTLDKFTKPVRPYVEYAIQKLIDKISKQARTGGVE